MYHTFSIMRLLAVKTPLEAGGDKYLSTTCAELFKPIPCVELAVGWGRNEAVSLSIIIKNISAT